MDEFYDTIKARIEEENGDVIFYEALAHRATDDGAAQILRDIAREEAQHAENLAFILSHKEATTK